MTGKWFAAKTLSEISFSVSSISLMSTGRRQIVYCLKKPTGPVKPNLQLDNICAKTLKKSTS